MERACRSHELAAPRVRSRAHGAFGPSSQQRRRRLPQAQGRELGRGWGWGAAGRAAWRSHIPSLLETGALSGKGAAWETCRIRISGLAAFATTARFFLAKGHNNHWMPDSLPLLSSPTPTGGDMPFIRTNSIFRQPPGRSLSRPFQGLARASLLGFQACACSSVRLFLHLHLGGRARELPLTTTSSRGRQRAAGRAGGHPDPRVRPGQLLGLQRPAGHASGFA